MFALIATAALVATTLIAPARPADASVEKLNHGWKFSLGEKSGAERPEFDDSNWQRVRVPHDWAIAGPFDAEKPGHDGKLPWRGVGWYRNTFHLDKSQEGSQVYFDFDGVMAFPKVYINGKLAGQWDYGYMSFRVDATPYVKFGADNVIAVEVDTRKHFSRWYPGAGIYRKVTMTVDEPIHLAHWGTFVTTPQVSDESATAEVTSTIENHLDEPADMTVAVTILGPDGKQVATASRDASVPAHGDAQTIQTLQIPSPERWDVDHPALYTLKTSLRRDGQEIGGEVTKFGIRTFEFTADDGFILNGRRLQLYGVNLHHDHGPLGGAFSTRAMERQLEIMRDMGVNAIRTSHNAPAPEVLDLADRMGFFVWDECFDKWNATADLLKRDTRSIVEHADKQLTNMVKRDRNHPSIFVWSIGNEIDNSPDERGDGMSLGRIEAMRNTVRALDDTRPVTIVCHTPGTADVPIVDPLELTGWNYGRRYARMREKYPEKPIIYSESASTVSTRGFYALPLANTKLEYPGGQPQVSSYDLSATPWSDIPDVEFDLMERDTFIGGEFVWTGFDYLGEPTPFAQEAKSSYFGIVDLVGIPKDRFYLYRSYWRPDVTTIHILPHWNWPERIGQNVPVFVYTNGDSAELFVNGKSQGRRTKGEVPPRPENLALGKPAQSSSSSPDHDAERGDDGDLETAWRASESGPAWWQVDLGHDRLIRFVRVDFARGSEDAGYDVKVSSDGRSWETAATKDPIRDRPDWQRPAPTAFHPLEAQARYVRIEFTENPGGRPFGISEFGAYASRIESEYYDVTYKYRLRWNDVVYEPGELKVVAYKDGQPIGEATMRTAGEPAQIHLTPDRAKLAADGEDLSYILVEAHDRDGNLCPLADDMVKFSIDGPAEIAGVGNGNPLSLEPFQADHRKLFFGKAMVIVRPQEGDGGAIRVTAQAEGMEPATVELLSAP